MEKIFNIVSCHRRLKYPTSDGCRSRISHKSNLILVDKLSTRNRADESASKLTLDKASRFHRIASSTAVCAEKAIGDWDFRQSSQISLPPVTT